jgi:hypothetical protein
MSKASGILALGLAAPFGLWLLSPGALAQSAATPPTPPKCELHIFPSQGAGVYDATQSTMGGIVPALLNDALRVKKPEEITAFIDQAMPLEEQVSLLKSIDYAGTKMGSGKVVTVHDKPNMAVTGYNFNAAPRTTEGGPVCYGELVLASLYLEKNTLRQMIKTSYFYREFSTGSRPIKVKFAGSATGIGDFPPKTPDQANAATQNIKAAFKRNVLLILNK